MNGQLVNRDIVVLADAEAKLTPDAACCVCGGGMAPSEKAQLVSWSLIVYGRGTIVAEESEAENTSEEESGGGMEPTVDSDSTSSNGNRLILSSLLGGAVSLVATCWAYYLQ